MQEMGLSPCVLFSMFYFQICKAIFAKWWEWTEQKISGRPRNVFLKTNLLAQTHRCLQTDIFMEWTMSNKDLMKIRSDINISHVLSVTIYTSRTRHKSTIKRPSFRSMNIKQTISSDNVSHKNVKCFVSNAFFSFRISFLAFISRLSCSSCKNLSSRSHNSHRFP